MLRGPDFAFPVDSAYSSECKRTGVRCLCLKLFLDAILHICNYVSFELYKQGLKYE